MADDAILTSIPIQWLSTDEPKLPDHILDWLMEVGSMTCRFEQYCQTVSVAPFRECFITAEELGDESEHLPLNQKYWLRETILYGDNIPWLLGRTVVPEETLTGPDRKLVNVGTVPLGRYLFSSNNLTRDYIQIGQQGERWGRRSLLRLSGKPLLLTEVFLPESPAYKMNKTKGEK
ncbi:chorismate lyase [Xenorhabdus szentirmaii]|uniref:Chorismate pyruvate-lyase n=2 Tax=Xenorhabdus szentirmaii TaxID=290112 RepID=W1IVU2_9GAMM|nr:MULTISPECIES: chorismate lyase [Xenorhabdus]MBD2782039.1 chorismate lyase [Xenorhabdus sp. 38]MBD2791179.1 chorismate lyase [Xenorhabdus sp. CUL]MBD2802415.1 chorismate lyase [Xenorhabdus sp. M]MBD2805683.1 chorismate lyase [Xenorhabdus sp. ZM]MBD2821084.1 chorismate lyase [Xenorhabdus sp. 42]